MPVIKQKLKHKTSSSRRLSTEDPEDEWPSEEEAHCDSCVQNLHDMERDSAADNRHFLVWTKTVVKVRKVPIGRKEKGKKQATKNVRYRKPAGKECYRCYDVRRRFSKGQSQAEVLKLRKAHPAVEQAFLDKRHAREQGDNAYDREDMLDLKRLTATGEEDYEEEFETGARSNLIDFCRTNQVFKKGFSEDDIEGLMGYVVEHYPHVEIVERQGEMCVDTPHATRDYKRAKKDFVKKTKVEEHGSKLDWEERFAAVKEKLASKMLAQRETGGGGGDGSDGEDEAEEPDEASEG
jgi:hypothetical protein